MRYVEITVPAGKREAILDVLDDEEIDYVVSDETSSREFTAIVSFPLPTNAVEPVLDRLRETGLEDHAYTVVLDAETVISRRYEQLEERYEKKENVGLRISRPELRSRVQQFIPEFRTYAIMVVASVAIATAGVLLDSAAVVVGSMVIAPLIGPAMATSTGTVLQDRELFIRGTRLQLIGAVLAVITAAVFAWFVKTVHLVPPGIDVLSIGQVRERLAPDFLSLVIAVGAGVAGAYSLTAGVSTALVGVMIAVALVPPIAVIGVGIAWGLPQVVVGSTVLVLVNFASINLAALVVLWYQGYRPEHWFREEEARIETLKRAAVLIVIIAVLSSFLAAVTVSSFQAATLEEDVRGDVKAVLEDEYPALVLIELTIESDGRFSTGGVSFLQRPQRVIVTVGRPAGTSYPDLGADIAARINDDRSLTIEVRFVDTVVQTPRE